ncbi:MAG: helix-turn-helix transcriptional regulator [Pseudomonadota bacterium]
MGEASHRSMRGPRPSDVLTDAQLACVRLVGTGPSKVIAKQLHISHHTVDDHLRQAMRRLEVSTRHEAAALVAEWDRWEQAYPQELMPQPRDLADQQDTAILVASSAIAGTPVSQANVVREDHAEYGETNLKALGMARLTQYWLGSLFDDLTGPKRLQGTLKLALIVSFIVLVLVGVGNAIQLSVLTYYPASN